MPRIYSIPQPARLRKKSEAEKLEYLAQLHGVQSAINLERRIDEEMRKLREQAETRMPFDRRSHRARRST